MNYVNEDILSQERITITNLLQEIGTAEVRKEILEGLQRKGKYISSKFLYNEKGSELFTEITRLPEYYPTRTEKSILERIATDLMRRHRNYDIVELGPGDPAKISILLQTAVNGSGETVRYLPLDISQSAIGNIADSLVKGFSHVEVEGYALDFMSQFEVLDRHQPQLICFLGSTIGNLEYTDALTLLAGISSHMKAGDTLLLGTDLLKPETVLHEAYNDAAGVTRQFNLNILNSINDLILSDFDTLEFRHLAFFNPEFDRVEMHLVALRDLTIHSPYMKVPMEIAKGEHIHTENSHKYSKEKISEMAMAAELDPVHIHTDERCWFALTEFRK